MSERLTDTEIVELRRLYHSARASMPKPRKQPFDNMPMVVKDTLEMRVYALRAKLALPRLLDEIEAGAAQRPDQGEVERLRALCQMVRDKLPDSLPKLDFESTIGAYLTLEEIRQLEAGANGEALAASKGNDEEEVGRLRRVAEAAKVFYEYVARTPNPSLPAAIELRDALAALERGADDCQVIPKSKGG